MTNNSWPDRPPIETTRVGGGSSARIAVLVALIVLGGVVLIGIAGRRDPPAEVAALPSSASLASPARPAPSTASKPTSEPTPQPNEQPTETPRREPTPTPESFEEPITLGQDAFAVIASIGGRMYLEVLHEDEPGHLHGKFRLPFPQRRRGQTIELAQLWTRDEGRPNFVRIGEWRVRFDPLGPTDEPQEPVLRASAAGQPDATGVPRAIALGYDIVVTAETRGEYGAILIDLWFGR